MSITNSDHTRTRKLQPGENDATRLFSKTTFTKGEPCWEFNGYRDPNGYGRIYWKGKQARLAHRVAYELAYGAIPPGMAVDHLCSNRACIRYEHLEVVTQKENLRRAAERRTHCGNGHAWTPENTYTINGNRRCRACGREATKRYYYRNKAKHEPAAPPTSP